MVRLLLSPLLRRRNPINLTKLFHSSPDLSIFLNSVGALAKNLAQSVVFHERLETKDTQKDTGFSTAKAKLILQLQFEAAEDVKPFYKLPVRTLLHIYKTNKNDESNGFCKNRLYYLAHHINCPPAILSERLANRTFIYKLPFDWLQSSLNVLLEMDVSGDRIMRDLWVLKYHHETIRERLQKVKDMDIDTLYPWMVRCSEDILTRFVEISQETKHILGDNQSTQIYLANRLGTSPEFVENMCSRIPALKTIRVSKIKHFLDFLTKEGFEVQDIANKLRVLTASQKTVEQRLERLRALGVCDINLNVLCKSKKDFKKYCEVVISTTRRPQRG